MLSQHLERTLHKAFVEARAKRQPALTVEHVACALLDDPDAGPVLQACSVDVAALRKLLDEASAGIHVTSVHACDSGDTPATEGLHRVISVAADQWNAADPGARSPEGLNGVDLLDAILEAAVGGVPRMLAGQGVTREALRGARSQAWAAGAVQAVIAAAPAVGERPPACTVFAAVMHDALSDLERACADLDEDHLMFLRLREAEPQPRLYRAHALAVLSHLDGLLSRTMDALAQVARRCGVEAQPANDRRQLMAIACSAGALSRETRDSLWAVGRLRGEARSRLAAELDAGRVLERLSASRRALDQALRELSEFANSPDRLHVARDRLAPAPDLSYR